MELSKRLAAVAGMVTAGYKTVDIGTDHAYIPIYLMEKEVIPSAIAVDINRGPLARARKNIKDHGLSGGIETRLSDGMKQIAQMEAEAAVLAGMGGGLAIKILKESFDVAVSFKELILQPQSEIAKVRAFLLQEGFSFVDEDMVLEDGKFYTVIKVLPPSGHGSPRQNTAETARGKNGDREGVKWDGMEIQYGRILLQKRHPILKIFLERELSVKREIYAALSAQHSDRAGRRARDLEREITFVEKGLKYYALQ